MKSKSDKYREAVERSLRHMKRIGPDKYLPLGFDEIKTKLGIKKKDTSYDRQILDLLKKKK